MPKLTKAERERQEHAANEARIRAALRWTEEAPGPDVPPGTWRELSTGYMFNAPTGRVDVACSSRIGHAIGQTDTTTTQGSLRLYSTRRKALLALRNAVERACAERLAKIDEQIEGEMRDV